MALKNLDGSFSKIFGSRKYLEYAIRAQKLIGLSNVFLEKQANCLVSLLAAYGRAELSVNDSGALNNFLEAWLQ